MAAANCFPTPGHVKFKVVRFVKRSKISFGISPPKVPPKINVKILDGILLIIVSLTLL